MDIYLEVLQRLNKKNKILCETCGDTIIYRDQDIEEELLRGRKLLCGMCHLQEYPMISDFMIHRLENVGLYAF